MSEIMLGAEVAAAMKDILVQEAGQLESRGVKPLLSIIRVGARPDDLAYERGATKRMSGIGIECRVVEFPEDVSQADFEAGFQRENDAPAVHGILLFRPLPKGLDEEPVKAMINPIKDVDCMCAVNLAKVFSADESGHAPCTAEAVMEMLDYYKIDPEGKKVTVIGRSMVIGKPVSMLLLKRNATVTICHTRTRNMVEICKEADILVAAAGKAKMVTGELVGKGAVVLDVGINVDSDGGLCGDVAFEEVKERAAYISPVPRGVGSVTTSVLAKHVIKAAKYLNGF